MAVTEGTFWEETGVEGDGCAWGWSGAWRRDDSRCGLRVGRGRGRGTRGYVVEVFYYGVDVSWKGGASYDCCYADGGS